MRNPIKTVYHAERIMSCVSLKTGSFSRFFLFLNAFFFDTLEKTRYAVCNSASHMINFDCHTPFRISLTDEHRPSYLSRLYESEDHDDD